MKTIFRAFRARQDKNVAQSSTESFRSEGTEQDDDMDTKVGQSLTGQVGKISRGHEDVHSERSSRKLGNELVRQRERSLPRRKPIPNMEFQESRKP